MDQKKIGSLLRELRKEQSLTQAQLAERFHVSDKTVSRWENGSNMPDLSLLVEIADFYDIDIREIMDGERKSEKMNSEEKDTLRKAADYAESEKDMLMKRVCIISFIGLGSLLMALLLVSFGLERISSLWMCIEGIAFGMSVGALITCILFTTGALSKIRKYEKSRRIAKVLRIVCPVIAFICVLGCLITALLNK